MGSKSWTAAEIEYLTENWGTISVEGLSKKLGRSQSAVINKKGKLGLGAFLECGNYVTLNQLMIAVTGSNYGYSYKQTSWVKNRELPVHTRKVKDCGFQVIYLDEFWKWAEKNRSFIDFSKMEPHILGAEPEWVKEQRKKDFHACALQRKDPWTSAEDSRLISLLKQHKYTFMEISRMLYRTAGAIERRCLDLQIKERPVKAGRGEWTENDFYILAEGIKTGESYSEIGFRMGKSEKAVRGKVYFVYLTENADKIRAMMGNGQWGDGAPDPTVKQGLSLSRCRTSTLKDLSRLAGILAYHRNELGYEPYWQRHMCAKWDEVKGCTAGETDCDSCTSFQRIRPQYCVRCGAIFYERKENKVCARCRNMRRKQAARKAAVMAQKSAA